jgi:hypothetical protein
MLAHLCRAVCMRKPLNFPLFDLKNGAGLFALRCVETLRLSYWKLPASDLWKMGYQKCAD